MEDDIQTFEITLILKVNMGGPNTGQKTPEYWNWWEMLDLGSGDEDVYVLECKRVDDNG